MPRLRQAWLGALVRQCGPVATATSSNNGQEQQSGKPRARHDQAYKGIFAIWRALHDLVLGYASEFIEGGADWLGQFDFERAVRISTEEIVPGLASRLSDMVWRIPFRSATGQTEYLYVVVLMEFQSSVDRFMALRVQSAVARLYEGLRKGGGAGSTDWVVPVLAVVVYNGKARWNAPTRMWDLVRPEVRPAAGPGRGAPTYTGDSYVVIDIGGYEGRELPSENVVSVVIRTELMDGLESAGKVIEESWRELDHPQLRDLREHYLEWFDMLLQLQGLKWEALEDPMEIARLAEAGELRTTLEERVQAANAALKAEGREEGREEGLEQGLERGIQRGFVRERELLTNQAQLRFGTDTANHLARHLAGIADHGQLLAVSEWIVASANGSELLDRVRAGF